MNIKHHLIAFILTGALAASCGRKKPEPIAYGKDSCSECKMTIIDPKFGGEIISKKGKIFKFDDTHCLAKFMERRGIEMNGSKWRKPSSW